MAMFTWLTGKRLQTQLLLWTALILAISIVFTGEVRTRANIHLLEENLQDRSETLIRAVDRALRLLEVPLDGPGIAQLEQRLRDFAEADRTLTRLDVVDTRSGELRIVATSSSTREPIIRSLQPSLRTDILTIDGERVMITTQPVSGSHLALVAVSSLVNVDRYEDFNRSLTPAFTVILMVTAISLMSLLYQRTISRRFDALLEGIRQAKDGEITQIPEGRPDEIGTISKTLNGLLAQVRSFNDELQSQVARATGDLNKRNRALEETTRQVVGMQQQLLQAERLATVGQMAATFAHEIGSPMSSLSAHVQLILEDPNISREQRESLLIVREQIQAVVQIVNDLLRSARRGPDDFVLTDINETLRTVIRLVQPKLMSQKIEVTVDLQPVPLVRGYPLYLQEAFLNIVNNASEAMPDGGRLEVKSWFDETTYRVNIRMRDSGPGIDASLVEHMFDHFVTTRAIGHGTGLGLGIVKEIVNSHRGTIQVASNDGSGTAAHITFPVETASVRAS